MQTAKIVQWPSAFSLLLYFVLGSFMILIYFEVTFVSICNLAIDDTKQQKTSLNNGYTFSDDSPSAIVKLKKMYWPPIINSRYSITRIVLPSRGSGGRNARTLTTTADLGLLNKQSWNWFALTGSEVAFRNFWDSRAEQFEYLMVLPKASVQFMGPIQFRPSLSFTFSPSL